LNKIDPMLYGTNGQALKELGVKSCRFGGNGVSRANFFNGKYNNAADWDFSNVGSIDTNDTANPYLAMKAWGCEPIMQAPLEGYVSADETWGNVKVDPVKYTLQVMELYNDKKKAGVKYWCVGNEPDCWRSTHSDIWKHDLGYQEYFDRFARVAAAMKKKDPTVKLLGPSSANEYFYYNLNIKEETEKFGPWLPWFLKQCADYEKKNKLRILDYLDIHRYPSGNAMAKDSLLMVGHEWWDSTVKEKPFLPTFNTWIKENYPGTKLSVTEYGFWGVRGEVYEAVWATQMLGAFGKYGVSISNAWYLTDPTKLIIGLYGNLFGDISIDVTSTDPKIDVFASKDSKTGDIILNLVNRNLIDTASVAINLPRFKQFERWNILSDSSNGWLTGVVAPAADVPKDGTYRLAPISITCLRFLSNKKGDRRQYGLELIQNRTPPPKRIPGQRRHRDGNGPRGQWRRTESKIKFCYPTIITYDRGGYDSLATSGDCNKRRGGADDQVPTSIDVKLDSTFAIPKDAVIYFENSWSAPSDALMFTGRHNPGGWWDIKLSSELKWPETDISKIVSNNGKLVLYVNGEKGGEDFTVYLENRENPRMTLQLRISDYLENGIDSDIKTWQKVEIPLKDFDIKEQNIDVQHLRYLGFSNGWKYGNFKVYVDNIYFY
jgi:hypothetical protein